MIFGYKNPTESITQSVCVNSVCVNPQNNNKYLLLFCGFSSLTALYYYIQYKKLQYTNSQYKKYVLINFEDMLYNLKVDNKIF
jgi:hypothetical protein